MISGVWETRWRVFQKITDIYSTSVDYNKDAPT